MLKTAPTVGSDMSSSSGAMAFLKRDVGPLTVIQILMMLVSLLVGIALLNIGGWGRSMVGWLIIGVIVYFLPHLVGATIPVKASWMFVFALIMVLIGGTVIGPAYVEESSINNPDGSDAFTDIQYDYGEDGTITLTTESDWTLEEGQHMFLVYTDVPYVSFRSSYWPNELQRIDLTPESGNTYTATISVDTEKLWFIFLTVATVDENGNIEIVQGTATDAVLSGDCYTGSMQIYVKGAALCMLYIGVIYFAILVFSALLRRMLGNKRKDLEDSGRLYPQGYGRCDNCGTVVLPGEVKCRKCGTYIDRPDSMRPRKKDYF